jgi:hypothetical protein
MRTALLKIVSIILFLGLIGAGCKKEDEGEQQNVNITLYNQPLSVIQKYITGNWKLQYSFGGLAAHKTINTDNYYMILSPDHIIEGSDSEGVYLDDPINWIKTKVGTDEFTYLLSYPSSSISYIIVEIKNDTLVIRDNLDDGFSYYYTKH